MAAVSRRIICSVTNDLVTDQRMQRICGTLAEAGYEVVLVGRIRRNSGDTDKQPYRQHRIRCFVNRGFLFYAEFNIRLFLFLIRHRTAVYCGVDLDTLGAVWLAAALNRSKCLYDAHEYFPESPELEGRTVVKRVWYGIEAFLVPKVHIVTTVSSSIADVFHQRYGRAAVVIRNLPRRRAAVPAEAPRFPYMLYQGALNVGRGLETLIGLTERSGMELWLAGEGDISDALKDMARREAPGKVRFLGSLPPSALRQITAGAVMGLNLLEPMGASYRMSLGNKFFDYIMAGIPQVSIGFHEYRAVNDAYEVAVLVDDLDPEKVLEAILSLKHDTHLRQRLTEQCLLAREVYCWERESSLLLDTYGRLFGRKPVLSND